MALAHHTALPVLIMMVFFKSHRMDATQSLNTQYMCKPEQTSQCFVKVPSIKYHVMLGHSVVFPCQVHNLAGRVQWRLKDTMMGYKPTAFSFPRFLLIGNEKKGEYNLKILNITETDQGEYECQVSPKPANPLLRVGTNLFILRKPEKPVFMDSANLLEVNPNVSRLSITCQSQYGNPPASFTWYRNGQRIRPDDTASIFSTASGRSRLIILSSLLRSQDTITCKVTNDALRLESDWEQRKYQVNVVLQVIKEPGQPIIQGFKSTWKYRTGDRFNVTCTASSGTPEGSLIWNRVRRNGMKEALSFHFEKRQEYLVNVLSTTLSSHDHNAEFICSAQNRITKIPREARIRVPVEYPPSSIFITMLNTSISGSRDLVINRNVGSSGVLVCTTSTYYGVAKIFWYNETYILPNHLYTEREIRDLHNGNFKISELRIHFHKHEHERNYKCLVRGVGDIERVAKVQLRVNFPPSKPLVRMLTDDNSVELHGNITLRCDVSGGNPQPLLSWYKDNNRLFYPPSKQLIQANVVTSFLTFQAKISDNGAKITCNANNSVLSEGVRSAPFFLNVFFPPQKIDFTAFDALPVSNSTSILLRCAADISNPPAIITWTLTPCNLKMLLYSPDFGNLGKCPNRDTVNSEILKSFNTSFTRQRVDILGGSHFETVSFLKITLTHEMDLSTVICRATNPPFMTQHNLEREFTLRVTYPPYFMLPQQQSSNGGILRFESVQENQNSNMPFNILANPRLVEMQLLRRGERVPPNHPRVRIDLHRAVLLLRKVQVGDMDEYTLIAKNALGITHLLFFLNVTFPATILLAEVSPSGTSWQESKEHLTVECRAQGNPVPFNIQWVRQTDQVKVACDNIVTDDDGNQKLVSKCHRLSADKFQIINKLMIVKADRKDIGSYICEANNGVGALARSATVNVMVAFKPELLMNAELRRTAVQLNKEAVLWCRGRAWPQPDFTWFTLSKEGLERPIRISNMLHKLSSIVPVSGTQPATYEQKFVFLRVQSQDYMTYRCRLSNRYGAVFVNINLTGTSRPDKPRYLRVGNATASSIEVSWLAGHNGGFSQIFNVKYSLSDGSNTKFEDVGPTSDGSELMHVRLDNLLSGHIYMIWVNSRNFEHGSSDYTEPQKISTLPIAAKGESGFESDSTSLLVITFSCITGLFVLLATMICMTILFRRRQQSQCAASRSTPCGSINRPNQIVYMNNANKDSEVLELHLQARNGIDKAQLEYLTLPQDNSIKSYGLCQNSGEKGRVVFSDKDDGATNGSSFQKHNHACPQPQNQPEFTTAWLSLNSRATLERLRIHKVDGSSDENFDAKRPLLGHVNCFDELRSPRRHLLTFNDTSETDFLPDRHATKHSGQNLPSQKSTLDRRHRVAEQYGVDDKKIVPSSSPTPTYNAKILEYSAVSSSRNFVPSTHQWLV